MKKILFYLFLSIFALFALCPQVAAADPEIIDIAFSTNIHQRNPTGVFNPPGCCTNAGDQPASFPVVDSGIHRRVYLWNKINASDSFVLLHTWYKDGIRYQVKRTYTPWIDKAIQFIEKIKIGLGWKKIADVELNVKASKGWRTWSSKEIDPFVHKGLWKVHVSTTTDPNNIICVAYFKII